MKQKPKVDQRDRDDLVYGRHPVRTALEAGPVAKIYFAQNAGGPEIKEILTLARKKNVPFVWVDRQKLDAMAHGNNQGVAAQVAPVGYADFKQVLNLGKNYKGKGACLLFLDGVMDPQNLGAIIRSAGFFGTAGIVIPKWRAAPLNAAAVKTSAGAARLMPVAQVSNLAESMERAREAGIWLVGAEMSGEKLKQADIPRPFALVMGSEGAGLHDLIKKKCDYLVSIENSGNVPTLDSVNVSVAAGILLHHFS